MATTTSNTSTSAIDRFLAMVLGDDVDPSPWAEEAILDAVVPGWRFSVRGDEAIRRQLGSWYRDTGTFEELNRRPICSGEVVEFTVAWVEEGMPHAARQVHVLELDSDGRIARHDMWCGGRWSASLLAEMEATSNAG